MSPLARIFRDAGKRFSLAGSAFTAQAIAFTALFALVPLTLVAVAMLAFIYGTDEGIARAHAVIETYVPQIGALVAGNLDAIVRYRGISGAIGIVGLIWSGKNLFQALTFGLNRSLGITRYRHYVWDVLLALVLVPFAGVVLIVATVLPVAITLVVQFAGLEALRWAPQIASYAGSATLVFVVAALLYYYLPNHRARWRVVVPGALVCAVGYSFGRSRSPSTRPTRRTRSRSTARSPRWSCCCCGST